jgi:hypothetical protein
MNAGVARPISEAQKMLKALYAKHRAESGQSPNFEQFYPINLEVVSNLLGWRIERVLGTSYTLREAGSGYIQLFEPIDAEVDFDKKIITVGVDERVPDRRINFSLAHEIGHIILHGKEGLKTLLRVRPIREKNKRFNYRHPFEVEADRFASELLMPIKAVRYQFEQLFNRCEIMIDSDFARQIFSQHHSVRRSESLKMLEVAKFIAIHMPNKSDVSLVNFFGVSDAAMAKRLIELRFVLD